MPRAILAAVLSAAAASPALAQRAAVAASHDAWRDVTTYIARAAEQMPEADYAYRPVATVRTFGQIVGHVAGAQKLYCAAVLGEPAGNEDDVEKSATTKAALVAALKASTAYCERAYAITDAAAASGQVTLFGQSQSKIAALTGNASHNAEHYGNLVTYLRLKGMVPPSSQTP
jgi:uncharacterized damage-inducible protein DinB